MNLERGIAEVPSRLILPIPAHDGATLFKPAYIHDNSLGIKIVSVRPANAALGLPTVPATIMLLDIATAMPLCLMDGTYLTGLRFDLDNIH